MTEPLRLYRELDLSDLKAVKDLIAIIRDQPHAVEAPPETIEQGINSLVYFFPTADWLTLRPGMGSNFKIRTGAKQLSNIGLEAAMQLGLQLQRLQHCEGFTDLLKGFSNPTQFYDSVFEAAMADHCLPRVISLRFSPKYNVQGAIKHPDFDLATKYGIVVCECKSANEAEKQYAKKFDRLCQELNAALKNIGGIANDYRLEIHICKPLGMDVKQLSSQVAQEVGRLKAANILRQVSEVGPCKICLVQRGSPTIFRESGIWHESILVGDKPVGLGPQYAYLRVTTERVDRQRVKAAGDLIRDAKSQLPESQQCVILIQVINGASAQKAANLRLGRTEYSHVLACGIYSNEVLQFVYRTSRQPIVEHLFGPFANRESPKTKEPVNKG